MVDRAKVREWSERNLRNYQELGFGLWAMELRLDGRFGGDCGLTYQNVEGRRELEVHYQVIERQRGKGYATEAARACLEFGFTRTSCQSSCSIVRQSNTASCMVAARVHSARPRVCERKSAGPTFLYHASRIGSPSNGTLRRHSRSHAASRLRSGDTACLVMRAQVRLVASYPERVGSRLEVVRIRSNSSSSPPGSANRCHRWPAASNRMSLRVQFAREPAIGSIRVAALAGSSTQPVPPLPMPRPDLRDHTG
jgi:hypothetical protein